MRCFNLRVNRFSAEFKGAVPVGGFSFGKILWGWKKSLSKWCWGEGVRFMMQTSSQHWPDTLPWQRLALWISFHFMWLVAFRWLYKVWLKVRFTTYEKLDKMLITLTLGWQMLHKYQTLAKAYAKWIKVLMQTQLLKVWLSQITKTYFFYHILLSFFNFWLSSWELTGTIFSVEGSSNENGRSELCGLIQSKRVTECFWKDMLLLTTTN